MKHFRSAVLFSLLTGTTCFGQTSSTWYFGEKAGLQFTATGVTVLTNSALSTAEGSAAISDNNGNLLFYTDGITVYNRNHQVMPNGTGLTGHSSSANSAIIIPFPGRPGKYLVFTADAAESQFYRGYRYSEVDMTLNNGFGDVTSKNMLIYASGTERMTIVKHANGKDYWLVTKERTSNSFRTFKIDCAGVSPGAVLSNTGVSLTATPYPSYEGIGNLKSSPDGKMIGMTVWDGLHKGAYLYQFNNSTGLLSNAISLSPQDTINTAYGVEFSLNNQFVYISYGFNNYIRQYNISSWNATTINNSAYTIQMIKPYGLQRAPDGRIYIAKNNSTSISAILLPNNAGAASNFQDDYIALQPGLSYAGLPSFPNEYAMLYDSGFATDTVQLQGSMMYSIDKCMVQLSVSTNATDNLTYHWDLGNGQWDTGKTVTHFYADTGNYTVNVFAYWVRPCKRDTLHLKQDITISQPLSMQYSITGQCTGQQVLFNNLSISADPVQSWEWNFGDGSTANSFNASHTYSSGSQYQVRLKAAYTNGCTYIKTGTHDIFAAMANAGADTIVQTNSSFMLQGSGGINYEWSPSTGLSDASIANPFALISKEITYILKVTTAQGCIDHDTIHIATYDFPGIYIPTGFTPNNDGRNDFLRPLGRGISELKYFRIYNRWGNLLYSSTDLSKGWNGHSGGKPQPQGVYVWMLEAVDKDGNIIMKKGTTVLMR